MATPGATGGSQTCARLVEPIQIGTVDAVTARLDLCKLLHLIYLVNIDKEVQEDQYLIHIYGVLSGPPMWLFSPSQA